MLSAALFRGNGVTLRTRRVIQGDDNAHVDAERPDAESHTTLRRQSHATLCRHANQRTPTRPRRGLFLKIKIRAAACFSRFAHKRGRERKCAHQFDAQVRGLGTRFAKLLHTHVPVSGQGYYCSAPRYLLDARNRLVSRRG